LSLNTALPEALAEHFKNASGLGEFSARCVIDERNANGPFRGPADFDRRVMLLQYEQLCRHFDVSFDASSVRPQAEEAAPVECSKDIGGVCEAFESLEVAGAPARRSHLPAASSPSRREAVQVSITFAAWNCARMSPRSPNFSKKCSVLERLVADTPGLAVILLQEVVAGSMVQVVQRLRACTGDEGWTAVGCGAGYAGAQRHHSHGRANGATCQTALYNASKVRCIANTYVDARCGDKVDAVGSEESEHPGRSAPDASATAFVRPPHICVFQPVCDVAGGAPKLLCVANCHISQRSPRNELHVMSDLVQAMRAGCVQSVRQPGRTGLHRWGDVTYVLAGDFNQSAGSADFDRLRLAEDFIELVQAPRAAAGGGSSPRAGGVEDRLRYLTEATTRGGQHVDNVWMDRRSRCADVLDAWQYVPGGNGRGLHESGYASAGRMRSERSDHVAIVVKLRLEQTEDGSRAAAVSDAAAEGEQACWILRQAFSVVLRV
jgi:hypothetical protein